MRLPAIDDCGGGCGQLCYDDLVSVDVFGTESTIFIISESHDFFENNFPSRSSNYIHDLKINI